MTEEIEIPKVLTQSEWRIVSFALSCRLEDYQKEILHEEKRSNSRCVAARQQHADLTRILYQKINPSALCGDLKLMDGTTLTRSSRGDIICVASTHK